MTNEEFLKEITLEGEKWAPINMSGFENCYMISSMGRIIALSKTLYNGRGYRTMPPKMIRPCNIRGYYRLTLYNNNVKKTISIHKLVALTFISNPHNYKYIDHINCDSTDNRVENLRWCTASMNRSNPITVERHALSMSKSLRTKIAKIRPIVRINLNNPADVKAYLSAAEAEKEGFNRPGICSACRGVYPSYKGYKWFYLEEYQKLIKELDYSSPTKRKV